MVQATRKQLFSLFIGTGRCLELRNMDLQLDVASDLISRMKNGEDVYSSLINLGAEVKEGVERKMPKSNTVSKKPYFQDIYDKADKAGREAVEQADIRPMVVNAHTNVLDDTSTIKESYYVADGPCGFASIEFPANTSWARWCKKNNIGNKHTGTGYYIWVSEYNQSLQKKEKYASAFAKVLNGYGIKAYSSSRMD